MDKFTVLFKKYLSPFLLIFLYCFTNQTEAQTNILYTLESTIIFKGDSESLINNEIVKDEYLGHEFKWN